MNEHVLLELFEAMHSERDPSLLVKTVLGESALSRGINRNAHLAEATRGVETALEAMKALTKYCMELTETNSVSELNKSYRHDELDDGDNSIFSRAVGILLESYNIEWLDAYLLVASMRLILDEEGYADRLLVKNLGTLIMQGAIAVPVVQVLKIPIKAWVLYGSAALHTLYNYLPEADELNTFNGEETIKTFLESVTQEGMRSVLVNEGEAVTDLYLYITQGNLREAKYHVRMLEKAYDIISLPEEDEAHLPSR